ncbi:MAG: hypothetical protein RR868_08485 [Muribaculaceae bacterium]
MNNTKEIKRMNIKKRALILLMNALNLKCSDELIPQIEFVLEKLENESFEDMLLYDVKDEWLREIMDSANKKMNKIDENFSIDPLNATPLQKISCYQISSIAVDCDVSLRNIIIYALGFNLSDAIIEPQESGSQKFCLLGKEFRYQGDTMNSYNTTVNEFLRLFGDDTKYPKVLKINLGKVNYGKLMPCNGYSWHECILNNYDHFKDILPYSARAFIRLNHTIGNFLPVPFQSKTSSFNSPRGLGSTKDYWDLTLLHIYNWYIANSDMDANSHLSAIVKTDENIELCKAWLKSFTNNIGEPSWNAFVEENFLEDFVIFDTETICYREPKELWSGHFNGNILPQNKADFEQFFANASAWILARGSRIVSKVKMELENAKANI